MTFTGTEGPGWFHRDLLHTATWHGGFYPEELKNYLLVGVVVNKSIDEFYASQANHPRPFTTRNPRAHKQPVDYASRCYIQWRDLWCGAGLRSTNMSRDDILHGNGDGKNLSQWLGYNQVAFIPVRMPTPEQRFLWVDLPHLRHLPAVYVLCVSAEEVREVDAVRDAQVHS